MHPDNFDADEWLALLGPLDESCAPPEEPDWSDHPVYAEMVSDAERIAQLLAVAPADRPTGELARMQSRDLTPGSRVDLLAMLDQQEQYVRSSQQRLLADIDRYDSTTLGLSGELVSLVLRIPRSTAQNKLKTARALVDHLPATLAKLSRGEITGRHADVITEASWALEPDIVSEFEAAVLPGAEDRTVRSLQKLIAREAIRLDPASAEARHQRALRTRAVSFQPADDGMALLPVVLDAPDAQAVFTRLTAAAVKLPRSDPRTMDQKRADLLVEAVLTGLPRDSLPKMQGRKPSIQVTVSADTLLGLDDNPGYLAGYGPITAETARRLAADRSGTWRRLLTDPDTGQLLDIGADHYRPSQRLRDFVAARDDTCVFPGCNQPAYRCEFEHIVSFGKGGKTCRQGGASACKRHNLCKIDTGWSYRQNSDATWTWITDTGHRFTTRPTPRWPRPDDRPPPSSRVQPTFEQVHAEEDRAYHEVAARWHRELDSAIVAVEQTNRYSIEPRSDEPRATERLTEATEVGSDDECATRTRQLVRIDDARTALEAMALQRQRQLQHRADPAVPPF